jgi:hypothetical protein
MRTLAHLGGLRNTTQKQTAAKKVSKFPHRNLPLNLPLFAVFPSDILQLCLRGTLQDFESEGNRNATRSRCCIATIQQRKLHSKNEHAVSYLRGDKT